MLHPKFPHDRARVEAQLAEAFNDPSLPSVREIPSPFPADNLSSLHFGIEYLRLVQGEKHLVFLSQEHLGVGSKRMRDTFAQRAADARVTVTVLNSGGTPLTRLLQATRAGYSLAYYPTNVDWNGKLRRIEVRVNRSGLTLYYRRGYGATDEPPQR